MSLLCGWSYCRNTTKTSKDNHFSFNQYKPYKMKTSHVTQTTHFQVYTLMGNEKLQFWDETD